MQQPCIHVREVFRPWFQARNHSEKPLFVDERLDNDATAFAMKNHLFPWQLERLWDAQSLTAAVAKKCRAVGYGR